MRTDAALIDAGLLVAYLDESDQHPRWAIERFAALSQPGFTCEPVLTEASHLLRHLPRGRSAVVEMVAEGVLRVEFEVRAHAQALGTLIERYANVPMSLADASLVRMTEIFIDLPVLTLDTDFRIYRRFRNEPVPCILPPGR